MLAASAGAEGSKTMSWSNLIWQVFYYPRIRLRIWISSIRSAVYLWRFERMTPEQKLKERLRLGLRLDISIELYLRETRERLGLAK